MSNPWERLAAVLDKVPNSFASIDDGSHLNVLEWIFTEEEADLASRMKLVGETVSEMADRLKTDPSRLLELLETMDRKGQIRTWNSSTGRYYALMPFVVGIYEEQLDRMDERFAELAENYFLKSRGKGLFDTEPALFRVIPVNQTIRSELEIKPYQVAENLIETAESWGIRECICKKQQDLLGNKCSYPTSVCIIFAKEKHAFDNSRLTKPITKQAALEKLREAEEAGLVHCTMNIHEGQNYICNCCTCCCNVLRGVSVSGQPHAFVKSDYIISVDSDSCIGCATCVGRCQFQALSVPDDIVLLEPALCIGCGICAITCPEQALALVNRDGHILEPPRGRIEWMTEKAISRGVDPSDLL